MSFDTVKSTDTPFKPEPATTGERTDTFSPIPWSDLTWEQADEQRTPAAEQRPETDVQHMLRTEDEHPGALPAEGEWAEAVTDPEPRSGWLADADPAGDDSEEDNVAETGDDDSISSPTGDADTVDAAPTNAGGAGTSGDDADTSHKDQPSVDGADDNSEPGEGEPGPADAGSPDGQVADVDGTVDDSQDETATIPESEDVEDAAAILPADTEPEPVDHEHVAAVDPPDTAGNSADGDKPREIVEVAPPSVTQDYYPSIPAADYKPHDVPAFDGPPTREQSLQGSVGDCGVISTMGAVAGHRPEAIGNAIKDNGDGTFDITLYDVEPATWYDPVARPNGETTTYRVSNELPVSRDDQQLAGATGESCAWPSLLEKTVAAEDQTWDATKHAAWEQDWRTGPAKDAVDDERAADGLPASPDTPPLGYNRLDLGSTAFERADLLAKITGHEAEVRDMPDGPNLLNEFKAQLDNGKPVLVGTRSDKPGELFPDGVYPGHAYEVTAVDGDNLKLRNPWGVDHPEPMSVDTFLEHYRWYNQDGTRDGNYTTLS